jgi:hypothetical protein
MTSNKQPTYSKRRIRLPLDARKRISLAKILPDTGVSSIQAYLEGDKIILEPMAEIPARELWLYKNPKALASVHRGIEQSKSGKIKKSTRSFSEFLNEEV